MFWTYNKLIEWFWKSLIRQHLGDYIQSSNAKKNDHLRFDKSANRINITYKSHLITEIVYQEKMRDQVYFTTPVPETSDTSATRSTKVWHECYTNVISPTRVKFLILITTRVKIYFHTIILAIWKMKEEKNNFILRTTFWKCLVLIPKCVWKCTTKTEFCDEKSYIKNLYTRL